MIRRRQPHGEGGATIFTVTLHAHRSTVEFDQTSHDGKPQADAHDCGLVVNPEALLRTLECGMLHSLSRALHEEVTFETVCKPTLATVANAIFDATGVRLRRVPFRAARVLAVLKAAGT